MDYLKGHLWFSAQRYTQQGKWSEPYYHLADAQLYGEVQKHSLSDSSVIQKWVMTDK